METCRICFRSYCRVWLLSVCKLTDYFSYSDSCRQEMWRAACPARKQPRRIYPDVWFYFYNNPLIARIFSSRSTLGRVQTILAKLRNYLTVRHLHIPLLFCTFYRAAKWPLLRCDTGFITSRSASFHAIICCISHIKKARFALHTGFPDVFVRT